MRKESSPRNCPFCNAKGITKEGICDVCKGSRKVVIRYNSSRALNTEDIKVFDAISDLIKEKQQVVSG